MNFGKTFINLDDRQIDGTRRIINKVCKIKQILIKNESLNVIGT